MINLISDLRVFHELSGNSEEDGNVILIVTYWNWVGELVIFGCRDKDGRSIIGIEDRLFNINNYNIGLESGPT